MNRLFRLSLIVLTALGTTFPSAGLAQAVDSPTRSTPYRIAIFPFAGDFKGRREDEIAAILRGSIQRDRSLVLAYSHYDDVRNDPPIKRPERLWRGSEVYKKPNLKLVYAMARERGVQGVVMWWGDAVGFSTFADAMPPNVEVYMVDVAQRRVYRRKGSYTGVRKMTQKVLADFLKERPQVVASVKQQRVPPPSQPIGAQAGDWTINWCQDLTVDQFHKAAIWAFQKRKYAIEEDTPSSLTGAQKGKKVEVSMTAPGHIVIRWVPGFGHEKDDWLKYLWREVSVWLAQ